MEHITAALSKMAPWIWLVGCVPALYYLSHAWKIGHSMKKAGKDTSVSKFVRSVTASLAILTLALMLDGVMSIAVLFTYPQLQQARFKVPTLLSWYQLFTLLTLLAIPYVMAFVGWRKCRFLLVDDLKS